MNSPPSRASDSYLTRWTALTAHLVAGRFEAGLAVTREMLDSFPDRSASLSHAEAVLLLATDQLGEALDVMRRVADDGRWWSSQQLGDPDLQSLQQHAGFEELANVMREAEDGARSDAVARAAEVRVATTAARLALAGVDPGLTGYLCAAGAPGSGSLGSKLPSSRSLASITGTRTTGGRLHLNSSRVGWADTLGRRIPSLPRSAFPAMRAALGVGGFVTAPGRDTDFRINAALM